MGGTPNRDSAQYKDLVKYGIIQDYDQRFGDSQKQLQSFLSQAPVNQPDLSDPSIQASRQAQLLTNQLKRGRASTFLTPDQAQLAPPTVGVKSLLGG